MGLIKVVQKVLEEDGLKGFYKGVLPLCLGSFISYGVYFSSYEFLKHFLEKTFKLRQTNMASYALTSLIAGTLTTFATNPFWVVNTKMTMDKVIFKNIMIN